MSASASLAEAAEAAAATQPCAPIKVDVDDGDDDDDNDDDATFQHDETSASAPPQPAAVSAAAPVAAVAARIGGMRRGHTRSMNRARRLNAAKRREALEAIEYSRQAKEATRPRYNRGDVFEKDSVYTMQYKNAETDDLFARDGDARAERAVTAAELAAMEDPEVVAERERLMEQRLKQLEDALPETARQVDNLSAQHRPGERKATERFRGSFVKYAFALQREIEAAGAREMKERDERAWIAWLEKMYHRHQPFSDDHYRVFRKLCEGRLNEDPLLFRLLYLRALVEKGTITLDECNKLGSEYTTIETMYPALRAQVEEHRRRRVHGASGEDAAAAGTAAAVVADAEYVGGEGQWQWWSDGGALPTTFVQWCLAVRFAAEASDLDALANDDAYEVICCSVRNDDTGTKQIRFFRAGADEDDFTRRALTDATVSGWIDDAAVGGGGGGAAPSLSLNRDAHVFIVDRSPGSRDKWTVACYNVRADAPRWSDAQRAP